MKKLIMRILKEYIKFLLFYFFRLFPIQKSKIVATTMRGRKYGDNPQYIVEFIYKNYPKVDVVWLTASDYLCNTPEWIRKVPYLFTVRTIYELATAKVWIDTHRLRSNVLKRKGQCFIETWHGGLGIKKIEGDVPSVMNTPWEVAEIVNTTKLADVFISNSDHLTDIFRRAFNYQGPVFKCGYPKNDLLVRNSAFKSIEKRKQLNIPNQSKIALYAPTFRDQYAWGNESDFSVYDINYSTLKTALETRFGGEWVILVKWHPAMSHYIKKYDIHQDGIVDVTDDNDMQGLLCSIDLMISDYSSCLFDAALREIPCFSYATDFEEYKSRQGTYFDMEELPFPYAKNNEELINNILSYNHNNYLERWKLFALETGLHETGHATEDVANKIIDILNGRKVVWTKV